MRKRAIIRLIVVGLIAGCSQQIDDIDRTQPNKVQKSVFNGEWYLGRTVIDTPYTTDFTFIGEQSELERIRWEVQKDALIAYRVYDRVDGTDRATTTSGRQYQGAPIVAYRIESHFDIIREYNTATGEQSNVLVENTTDRPWYERDYIRVKWSEQLLPSFTFFLNYYAGSSKGYVVSSPLKYHVENPNHPHHMVMGVKNTDGSWKDHRNDNAISGLKNADYLETTTRVAAEPATLEVEDWYGGIWTDPSCWYYLNSDCEHQNIVVRTSFLKTDPSRPYEPLNYPDNELARHDNGKPVKIYNDLGTWVSEAQMSTDPLYDGLTAYDVRFPVFDKFGYFRIERHGYDPIYGERESNRTYLATRFNIVGASGEPKPIIYYYSEGFPDRLKLMSQEIANQYNAVFTEAAIARTGKQPVGPMFEIRENTGQRIGDIRYSFLHYVAKPTLAGLLGYGPSNVDPITGEIISATAYIYGAAIKNWAGMGRQVIDLLNGRLEPEDLGLGKDIKGLLTRLKTNSDSAPGTARKTVTMDKLKSFVAKYTKSAHSKAIKKAGLKKLKRSSGWHQGQLEKIAGTSFEKMLITDEVKAIKGKRIIGPGDPVPNGLKSLLSPVSWLSQAKRREHRKRRKQMMKRTMYMAEFADDAILGLALENKDTPPEALVQLLETAIAKSTAEHEIGHTLGLRHNFEGTYDALNYPRHFWDNLGANPAFPPLKRTPAQVASKMDQFRYSSVMDYPSRFNSDIAGLGRYEKAALMFGYAQMVEVFNRPPDEPLLDWEPNRFDLKFPFWEMRHYTSLPKLFAGNTYAEQLDAMFDRKFIPYEEYKNQYKGPNPARLHIEVPYRFCSDEYEGATVSCSTYDSGADPYEIVTDAMSRYDNYYFFDAFKRDRAGWDGWSYDWLLYDRYFRFMLTGYQHWAFSRFWDEDYWEDLRGWEIEYPDGTLANVITDEDWALAIDGGLTSTAATQESLNFLTSVLATPQPGGFAYNHDTKSYFNYTLDPDEWPTCGPTDTKEKDDWSAPCLDLNVPLGVGRYSFTHYDYDSGYYFYERPKWVGAFWDKLAALQVLTNPEVAFLGVNTGEDIQGYALGYWLFFPEIMSKVFGGIISDQFQTFAGTTVNGTYYPPNVFRTAIPDGHEIVDPDTWSTVQYWAMWMGMSGFSLGFDNTFNNLLKLWVEGGEDSQQDIPDPNAESVATYYHPETQRTYHAVKHPNTQLFSAGWEMVTKADKYQSRIDAPPVPLDQWDPGIHGGDSHDDYVAAYTDETAYTKVLLNYQLELMDLVRGMWELYGKLVF